VRLLPRSLFGRLVLILLSGLLFAQLVSAYLNLSERDQLLYRASGMQAAQRIADVSKLLDSVSPEERRRIVSVFRRAEKRPGSRPPSPLAAIAAPAAPATAFLSLVRLLMATSLEDHHAPQ